MLLGGREGGGGGHSHSIPQGKVTKGAGTYPYRLAAQIHAGYKEALAAVKKIIKHCRALAAASPTMTLGEAASHHKKELYQACFEKLR